MKIMDRKSFNEIRTWIHRNARPIDLTIWQYAFENGSISAVLEALAFYQNEDGGFGNTLEPDCWNPASSPYMTSYAIRILGTIGLNDTAHPLIQNILCYLESGASFENGLWLFSIPSNDAYPRAPWWTYNPEANKTEGIGVTATLAAFALRFAAKESALYTMACEICKQLLTDLNPESTFGDMGIDGYIDLMETIKHCGLEDRFDYNGHLAALEARVAKSIERDTEKWLYYGVRPSRYIHSPENIFYPQNKDIVEEELDYLIETRPAGDVWGISWTWFDLNEMYAKEFAISENWWKAQAATDKVRFLKAFGRIEF